MMDAVTLLAATQSSHPMLRKFLYSHYGYAHQVKFVTTLDLEIIAKDTKNYTSKAKPWLASQYLDLVKTDARPYNNTLSGSQ